MFSRALARPTAPRRHATAAAALRPARLLGPSLFAVQQPPVAFRRLLAVWSADSQVDAVDGPMRRHLDDMRRKLGVAYPDIKELRLDRGLALHQSSKDKSETQKVIGVSAYLADGRKKGVVHVREDGTWEGSWEPSYKARKREERKKGGK